MNKKLIAATLVISMLAAQPCVFAAFTDLEETRLEWAKTPIEEMTKLNIIKGYEDNTFRPDNAVSKAEALVLMSRIDGFYEDSTQSYLEQAETSYQTMLKNYATQYKDEVSYLLYRGVLLPDDLALYIGDTVAALPLKRYEAAILIAKLMGADVSGSTNTTLDFGDTVDIPVIAKPYVEYVAKNGIMKGMGDNLFEPMYDVSRAQMATLLYRVLDTLDYSYVEGSFSLYTQDSDNVKLVAADNTTKSYTVRSSVPAALDGVYATLTDFPVGASTRITFSGDKIVFIEAISPTFEETVECIYESFETLTDGVVITVKDAKTEEEKKYTLAASPTILKEKKAVAVTDLKDGDSLTLNIKNKKVVSVAAESKTKEITGTINSIILEPAFRLVVTVGSEQKEFDVYDSISVKRNGKVVTLSDVMAGDSVTITLSYNIISSIVATSSVSKKTGTLQEIRISNTPSIVVKNDSEKLTTYSVLRTVEILRNGSAADMYSLRVGDSVTITVEGSTVTKIELTSAAENSSITGKVEYVNSAYGYVKLYDVTDLIFTNKAKVQDNAGKSLTLRDVKAEVSVTVFGTQKPGSFEASLIIVN